MKDPEGNWKVLEISKRCANKRDPFVKISTMRQKPSQHCLPGAFHYVFLVFQFHHKNVQIKKEEQVITGALRMVVKNRSAIIAHLVQQGFVLKE